MTNFVRRVAIILLLCTAALVGWHPAGATSTPTSDDTAAESADDSAAGVDTDYGRMLLVLDSSGSMAESAGGGSTKIEAARQALGEVVDNLPDAANVGLRVYGAEVFSKQQPGACRDSQLVVPPGTDNRSELRDAVESYQPYGETPIAFALEQAAKDIGGEGTRSIVLVSDGIATCEPDPCVVAGKLADRGIDLQIDVVGINVGGDARGQLRCIAAEGGGTFYDADSAEDIVESLSTVSERALRPFELEGEPVDGGTRSSPTSVEVGRYVDELNPGDETERWFSVDRTIPGSSLHLSASSLGSGSSATMDVEASLPEGGSCGSGFGAKQINSAALAGAGVVVGAGSEFVSDECVAAETILVKVSSVLDEDEGPVPFGLSVVEEPPADGTALAPAIDAFDSTYRAPEPSGPTRSIVAGTSFGEAAEVSTGRWSAALVPGETQVFKVPLDYGQSVSVRVLTPAASPSLRDQAGPQGPFTDLSLFNPLRMETQSVGQGSTDTGFATGLSAGSLGVGTTEVRYNNRANQDNGAHIAGDYFIVYSADEDDDGGGYEMPYTLEVEVVGEPSGAPTYVDEQQPLTGDEAESATDEPASSIDGSGEQPDDVSDDEVSARSDRSTDSLPTPLVALLIAVLAVLAAVCLVVAARLLRRSR